MTVYIAEKPDIATAIASYLWTDFVACRSKHCYQKDDVIVTWAFGHILMTAMPEAYDKEYADFKKYPIFPTEWKKLPSPTAKGQFEYIRTVLKKADVVVNGGDPDREGQLLIDEILEYVGYKGDVRRILINAKDSDSMKRAFDNIVPNERFRSLYHAGMARERADWLVGINLSRAYTISARTGGNGCVWRVGRVKTPTLALVVNREKEIKDFHSINYYELKANLSKGGIPFTAWHYPWSSGPLYFSPVGLWSSPKWTDKSVGIHSSGLTQLELIKILKVRTVPAGDVRIIDGMVFPGEYVAYELVERLFKTRKSFNYFFCKTREEDVDARGGTISQLSIPMQEMRQHKNEVCRELFGVDSIRTLSTEQRLRLAKVLKSRYNSSLKQIIRLSGLLDKEVKELL